jgi:hypothetical protein
MLKTVSTQLALASDTLSEILANGNTSGPNNIIMDAGYGINGTLGATTPASVVATTVQVTSNTAFDIGLAGRMFKMSGNGLTLQGVTGSAQDFIVTTPSGQILIANPTGTNNVVLIPTASGNVGIGTSIPATALSVVGDITTTGGVYLGGTGAANLLDDYEEGTFTAVLGGSGGTSGQTYTFRQAKYTKVGNLVTCVVLVQVAAKGTITGNLQIQGLPFVSASYATISAPYLNGFTGVTGAFISATMNDGETVFTFYSVPVDGSSPTILTTTALSAAPQLSFTISYIV